MQFSVERITLLKTLQRVQGVIERRQTIPIYGNVFLHAKENMLHIKAINKELSFEEAIKAHVNESGAITVSASLLYDIMRKLPDGTLIDIQQPPSSNSLIIKTGPSHFELPTLPADSFVSFTADGLSDTFSLTAKNAMALFRPRFCMSSEELRHFLNGLYIQSLKKKDQQYLRSVATDGHRLALHEIPLNNIPEIADIIIPRRTIIEVAKLIENSQEPLLVQFSTNKILFQVGNIIFISKLIDGTFPDYEQVIPAHNTHIMQANRIELLRAIDRVSLITSDKNGIRLTLSNNNLHLSAVDSKLGKAQEDIPVSYNGNGLSIGFNARYLLDAMYNIPSEYVDFSFENAHTPLVITPDNELSAFVIMPMHIS